MIVSATVLMVIAGLENDWHPDAMVGEGESLLLICGCLFVLINRDKKCFFEIHVSYIKIIP